MTSEHINIPLANDTMTKHELQKMSEALGRIKTHAEESKITMDNLVFQLNQLRQVNVNLQNNLDVAKAKNASDAVTIFTLSMKVDKLEDLIS